MTRMPNRPPGDVAHLGRRACGEVHGEPPFEGGPAGPLPLPRGLAEDVVEVVGHVRGAESSVEELRELAFEAVECGHARCPRARVERSTPMSAAIAERMTPSERWSRDLAVPSGMPRAAAASGSGIPRK